MSASQAFERRQLAWRGWRRGETEATAMAAVMRRREVWRLGLAAWAGGSAPSARAVAAGGDGLRLATAAGGEV